MSNPSRFIVAKFVPDLARMEPRNIGVFLWSKGKVAAKFLDAPEFISDHATYHRWIDHWQSETSGQSITPLRGGSVPLSDPKCMDVLLATQKGNYILVDAGEMLQAVRARDADAIVEYLFNELVSPNAATQSRRAQRHSFATACSTLLDQAGVSSLPGYTEKYTFDCPVFGVKKHLRFSYGAGSGAPNSVYQRVDIDKDPSVHDAALKIRAATDNAIINRQRCFALIQGSAIEASENGAVENRDLLARLCTVVNVEDVQAAVEELRGAAQAQLG